MKTLKNEKLNFKELPLMDEKGVALGTLESIKMVLENSQYDTVGNVLKATVILGKLPKETELIEIEDADYEFIKHWVNIYKPFIEKGLMFAPFFQQFND